MTDWNATAQINAKIEELQALPEVQNASAYQDRRVYINLAGSNRSFAGDRNVKLYWDIKAGWVIEGLKGTRSDAFATSLAAIRNRYVFQVR